MLIFAIVVIVLILLACVGYLSGRWEEANAQQGPITDICIIDDEARERVRNIMIDAVDEALHDQIKVLFQVWMKDDRGQPDRARVGARAAIRAHQAARKGALEWTPPTCN